MQEMLQRLCYQAAIIEYSGWNTPIPDGRYSIRRRRKTTNQGRNLTHAGETGPVNGYYYANDLFEVFDRDNDGAIRYFEFY
jgi:hypothetical protein